MGAIKEIKVEPEVTTSGASDPLEEEAEFIEGFSITGDFVSNLKDRRFKIIAKPIYETGQDLDNPGATKRKLVLMIQLKDGQGIKYYPNKTSQKTIINKRGYKLELWIGFEGEFITEKQKVGKETKQVIYIKE